MLWTPYLGSQCCGLQISYVLWNSDEKEGETKINHCQPHFRLQAKGEE